MQKKNKTTCKSVFQAKEVFFLIKMCLCFFFSPQPTQKDKMDGETIDWSAIRNERSRTMI
jgi:hypothetical protein